MLTCYDIAMLTFSCVAANHLGLVAAIEKVLKWTFPVVNCPKCFTFWTVLSATILSNWNIIASFAVSFISAYLALWINLLMAFMDSKFNALYDKIYSTTNTTDDGTEHT